MPSLSKQYQTTLEHPVLSTDNEYLAFITPDQGVDILSIRTGVLVSKIKFRKAVKPFLSDATILRWAPESILVSRDQLKSKTDILQTWILIASSNRILVIALILPLHGNLRGSTLERDAQILADYQFESSSGKIAAAEFVLDHNQALVTFDMNTHASLMSFTKPQRDDIPCPKFQDRRGLAQSSQQKCFALMLRSAGQDQVAVFTSNNGIPEYTSTFSPGTIDAQGMKWSPNNDPILVVWESATHGPALHFFTAIGHPLKQLGLRTQDLANDSSVQEIAGLGISCLNWSASQEQDTLLAAGLGQSKLILRSQNHKSMKLSAPMTYQHGRVIDGNQCAVWRQARHGLFEKQTTVFEAQVEPSSEIALIEVNTSGTMIATKLDTMPKSLWLWDRKVKQVAGLLMFQHDVRKVAWHPVLDDVMVIVTNDRKPYMYIFHNLELCPVGVLASLEVTNSTTQWDASWITIPNAKRCPLFFSGAQQFDIGLLGFQNDQAVFKSIIQEADNAIDSGDETSFIETPSKSRNESKPSPLIEVVPLWGDQSAGNGW